MTAHELARRLLAGPDLPVILNMGYNELANGREVAGVCRVAAYRAAPDGVWGDADCMGFDPDYHDRAGDVLNLSYEELP